MKDLLDRYLFGLFSVVFVITLNSSVNGQNQMDSLALQIDSLFDVRAYDDAVPLLLESLEIAVDSADLRRILADVGYTHHESDEFEQSLSYYLQAAEIAQRMRDSLRSARFIRRAGLN